MSYTSFSLCASSKYLKYDIKINIYFLGSTEKRLFSPGHPVLVICTNFQVQSMKTVIFTGTGHPGEKNSTLGFTAGTSR